MSDTPMPPLTKRYFRREYLADMLRRAANDHLWDGTGSYRNSPKEEFSCVAVQVAVNRRLGDPARWFDRNCVNDLLALALRRLGIDGRLHGNAFAGPRWRSPYKVQQTRFAWLWLAADIIEEQGVKTFLKPRDLDYLPYRFMVD